MPPGTETCEFNSDEDRVKRERPRRREPAICKTGSADGTAWSFTRRVVRTRQLGPPRADGADRRRASGYLDGEHEDEQIIRVTGSHAFADRERVRARLASSAYREDTPARGTR